MLVGRRQSGVSLVEISISLVLVSLLLMAAMPSFNLWIQNTPVRTGAESIANGLQLARNSAVRYNTTVRFDLTSTAGLIAWSVGCVKFSADCPKIVQESSPGGEGGSNARVGVSKDETPPADYDTAIAAGAGLTAGDHANGVSFNSVGRIPVANLGTDISRIDITNATASSARRLVIAIGAGGVIRMCDPAIALSTNAQGCT